MSYKFIINDKTVICLDAEIPPAVRYAVNAFCLDVEKITGLHLKIHECSNCQADSVIFLETDLPAGNAKDNPEKYSISIPNNHPKLPNAKQILHIHGSDPLGTIFGVYYVSEQYLGIDPFWYWIDQQPKKQDSIVIEMAPYNSTFPKVRFRGWFVNGEDCLLGWKDSYPPTREVWQPVFEALLRCGGNMVCAGTDLPRNGQHVQLAAEMGLWLTHHHAEPLGADMFARRYPDKAAIFEENSKLFEKLWREAIEKQQNANVIWTLGFRGQGDRPFWRDDSSQDTPEKRGRLISQIINRQYEILHEYDNNPVCCTNIYGEIVELYNNGYLILPDNLIKIWADNGYGKMVARRIGFEYTRETALPPERDPGPHGIYYHVNFHDLIHSNQLTELIAPELIREQIGHAYSAGADSYLIVNSGNIRPHIYTLDFVAKMWLAGDADVQQHRIEFAKRVFGPNAKEVAECYKKYFRTPIQIREYEDEKAGDEFYNHTARYLISLWLNRDNKILYNCLARLAGQKPLREIVEWLGKKSEQSVANWQALKTESRFLAEKLTGWQKTFFEDNMLLQIELYCSGSKGLKLLCDGFAAYESGEFAKAFVLVSQAKWAYSEGLKGLRNAEHDKWENFYRGDWLTNVKCTVQCCQALQQYLRVLGDGPSLFAWYTEYLKPKREKKVGLAYIYRVPMPDDELALKLSEVFELGALTNTVEKHE